MTQAYRDPVEFYRAHAEDYARTRSTAGSEGDWIARFLDVLGESASVLDVGCGTGIPIARTLAVAGYAVTGLDTTPAFLAMARANVPQGTFLQADMRGFDLAERFDGIVAWHSFFHLTPGEQLAALARFADHLAPGGVLMFTAGDRAGEVLNPNFGEDLYHASLAPDDYRRSLKALGFEVLAYTERDPAAGFSTVWLAQRVKAG